MPCPFLTRLSQSYVRNYAPTLLKMYGSQCPVMSRSMNTTGDEVLKESEGIYCQFYFYLNAKRIVIKFLENFVSAKCPFMKEVNKMVKEASQEDIIEMGKPAENEVVNG